MPTEQTVRVLAAMAALAPLESMSVAEGRARARTQSAFKPSTPAIAGSSDRALPGPGGRLPVRVYTPLGRTPFPILMFFHGSGFVVADLDTHDALCRHLCAAAEAVVVSVDYRLAPEHRFPAAPEDCLAATIWARANAAELAADPLRVAVCGDSAGGNLAAVTAIAFRDRGEALAGQVLLYPVLDHWSAGRPSYRENGTGFGLTAAAMRWYWNHYLADPADALDPRASPIRAPDLAGVAPALLLTAEHDVLRDEGEAYAQRLIDAGVRCDYRCVPGVIHAFASMLGVIDEAEGATAEIGTWLRARFTETDVVSGRDDHLHVALVSR